MKVKDLERTANVAWSPKSQYPIYLAAGTAAQQLDASFNTTAALEIYSLNLNEPGPDLQLVSSATSEHRFHKIIWSEQNNGTIIGGCDSGLIQIYSASKLLKNEEALIGKTEKHTGPVHALDINPFQANLLATGAGESEIFIWDLNNTTTPMSPGAKSQPLEDVLSVSWNRQVQHILASTFASKCVIWDLRKNEPIIKLTDTVSRIRWKVVAWHPEVATQLCLASEEDHSPIIQLWDLRFATSPLKTLENHQRGVLSVAWCNDDPDLLVSCGKDNRILCWDPNSNRQNGEVLAEIATTNQWSFDIAWCPRNPALIACPNFDGHVSIYSLMGGKTQQIQTTNKIADSFPGMDGYIQAPVSQTTAVVSCDLTKPPKWLRRPCGASFGFGGKLITFEHDKQSVANAQQNAAPGQPIPRVNRSVQISQVITEAEFVKKSIELEKAVEYGNFTEYCLNKADATDDQHKKYIWHFLRAQFEQNSRAELLNLLGYRIEDVNGKLNQVVGKSQNNVDQLTDEFSRLDDLNSDPFNSISQPKKKLTSYKIKTGDDNEGLITQALLLNNVGAAVDLCIKANRFADALIIATTGGPELLAKTQHRYLEQSEGYISELITSMISEDWASIINNCDISSWKEALAAALTHSTDEDLVVLCEQMGNRLEQESKINPKLAQDAQLCYICAGSFDRLVQSWSGNATKSTETLQELVELVTFLQRAVERQGRQVQVSGALAELLSRYASLLAAQGELSTAVAYLGNSADEKIASLRDRLYVSLGQKPALAHDVRQQVRRGSARTSVSSTGGAYGLPPLPSQYSGVQPPAPVPAPQPSYGNFNTGLPNATAATQPWQPQPQPPIASFPQPPTRPFSPAPQAPPRPNSVGSNQGSSGLPSRKYVLDPSVSANQYGLPPTRNQYAPLPSQPVPSFQNNYNSNAPYTPPALNPTPLVPNPSLNPVPLVPTLNPVSQGYNSMAPPPMSGQPPVEAGQPATSFTANAPPGWNDPPVISKPLKAQPKAEAPPSDPITHPIFGNAPAQPLPTNGYGDMVAPPLQPYNPNQYPGQGGDPNAMYQPQQAFAPPSTFNPGQFNQNVVMNAATANLSQPAAVATPEPPAPIQKPPIPEEHIHMQTVFDELRTRCSCASNNAQTKRKLEDVGRKLETLYDLLREHKLSPTTLASLHQMIQLIQDGNYTGGLHLHTQLVSGPEFAKIASFMPGLKVLLQCAMSLQVYLR
ncbi:protein transport protein Sec31A [Aethina tumida]|uniref:protein transport protein Sec31A n=1 Tax=Aethina tumida TaxID=116153 RepID=UPI0021487382|nr:protein transport protein Sec31A [Aethina tumida]XP_049818152.1 protein transport protein Sec31A [Aethina tumida]